VPISPDGPTHCGRARTWRRGPQPAVRLDSITLSHCMSWKAVPFARSIITAFVAVAALAGLAGCGSSRPAAPSSAFGTVFTKPRPVPSTPLVNQDGQTTSLGSFRGKFVVLSSFLTLCQEECPLTTGIFQQLQASVKAAGLAREVDFVEVTVDPGRDTPARLRAYQARFGVDWTLLTGTAASIRAFWKPLGVYYQKVPEGHPAQVDWWTGKPLTYDVDHSDGFFLIDRSGGERFVTQDIPFLHGHLPSRLRRLLDGEGLKYLETGAPGQDYTLPQAAEALSWLVERRIPSS
jgi:protein SCO1